MRRRRYRLALYGVLPAAIFLVANACGHGKSSGEDASQDPAVLKPGLFAVPENQRGHLKIAPVRRSNWAFSVHATATVDWDADQTTQVITQVSGPITRMLVNPGAVVTPGQPMLYVSSPDVSNAFSNYRKARNRLDLATRVMKRNRDLWEHHALARKDLESAEADYNDAFTDVQNSLQALKIFGITQKEVEDGDQQGVPVNPELAVRAPIAGTVVQKLVLPGQLIQAGATTCFLISDTSTVWVQGHVYEKDLDDVRAGERVDVASSSFPQQLHGTVSYIGVIVDPATRTTPVRIVTRNPNGLLKKDMFVEVVIHTRTKRNVLTVPASAVLHNAENEPFVYVQVEPGKFAERPISAGAQQDDEIEVLSGCKEGEQIVTEGSVFLQFAHSYE